MDEDSKDNESGDEGAPQMAPSQATARFYYELTYKLANEDITKFETIDSLNVYLCLNTASLIKDRIIQEKNEIKKLEARQKTR